jgi:hypothetical protein
MARAYVRIGIGGERRILGPLKEVAVIEMRRGETPVNILECEQGVMFCGKAARKGS